MRRSLLAAAILIAWPCLVFGQTGTFRIVSGPGAGRYLVANGGNVINSVPPGATTGNLVAPHAGAAGPRYHYHGTLLGVGDPNPGTFGWGYINFPATLARGSTAAPTTASGTLALTQGAPIPFHLLFDQLFPAGHEARPADSLEKLFGGAKPPPEKDRDTILKELQDFLIEHDATHAARNTPKTASQLRASGSWPRIELTGPRAKSL